MSNTHSIKSEEIQNKIYTIRGLQVMLDEDLSILYNVETRRINEQVKRNIDRFPEKFMFQLTKDEYDSLRSQIVTLENEKSLRSQNAIIENARGRHRKYLPFAFTEQGVVCSPQFSAAKQPLK